MSDEHVFALFQHEGEAFVPLPMSLSRWSTDMVGGYAVSGLLAHEFEPHCPEGFVPSRLGVEMFRPVPAVPLTVKVETLRDGNRIKVCDAVLMAEGEEVSRGSVTFLRTTEEPTGHLWHSPDAPQPPPLELHPVTEGPFIPLFGSDDRWATSMKVMQDAGRKAMWQGGMPLLPGRMPSAFERVGLIADAASMVCHWGSEGVGFINADVQVALCRLPEPTGLGIRADNQISQAGVSVGTASLFDRSGIVGNVTVSALNNAKRRVDFSKVGSYTAEGVQEG